MSDQWHGGKGSKRRPEDFNRLSSEWDRLFSGLKSRKKTPDHGSTQIHKDKTKQIPRHYKYNKIED